LNKNKTDHAGEFSDDALELEEATRLAETVAVGEYEEEVEAGGKRIRRRGVFMLPTMITLSALFAGFYAIVVAMDGQFEAAVFAIFVAAICDGLDGRIARLTNTQSAFGAELDSLADMVSFGVAPALIMFSWALEPLERWGWAAAFIYVACAAMRLARFNTEIGKTASSTFKGLASPAAAGVLVTFVWFCSDWDIYKGGDSIFMGIIAGGLTVTIGLMMVTNITYQSFKGLNARGRVPFIVIVFAALVISLISIEPATVLMAMAFIYAFSGPAYTFCQRWKKKPAEEAEAE